VRGEAYAEGEVPTVYILRKWERGSRKAPQTLTGIMETGNRKVPRFAFSECAAESRPERLFARRAGGASHFDPVLV
jgi:hypothetical protein